MSLRSILTALRSVPLFPVRPAAGPDSACGSNRSTTAACPPDVNGDGKADLVTANRYSASVGVLLGNGPGGFGPAQSYGTGGYTAAVALADFNHGGTPDVAAANIFDDRVTVLLGRGSGTFTLPVDAAVGPYPLGLAAGDFNGDGWSDAATANASGSSAPVLLNDHSRPPTNAPSVGIGDVTVTEGNTGSVSATFTLTLSAAYDQAVAVNFATALGATDSPGGWRADKPHGGIVMELPTGEVVARGLSMPHSPRWHDGRLWVCESGTGGVAHVDPPTGNRETVARLPGFTRGLAPVGRYAFVGLSKIRATSAMDGVPLAGRRGELACGAAAVDLRSGRVVGTLEFQSAVEEIFDVRLLPGVRFPEVVGFQ